MATLQGQCCCNQQYIGPLICILMLLIQQLNVINVFGITLVPAMFVLSYC